MTMAQTQQIGQWPATSIQRWMQAHDEQNPVSSYYVLPFTWRIAGQIDWRCFTEAFRDICTRHPVLTASLQREGDSWVQVVRPFEEVSVDYRDASGVAGKALEELLQTSYHEYCRRPFVLAAEPGIRVLVLQTAAEALVLGAYHQVVCDIESMAVFISEFSELYSAHIEGREPDLAEPGSDFGAYAIRTASASPERQAKHREYWQERLTGIDPRCPLQVDYPEAVGDPIGPTEYVKIGGPPTAIAVHALALQRKCSEHAVLVAAFSLVLARRAGIPSVVLSCPVSLRRSADLFRTVGPLTDMMWLRVDVDPAGGIGENADHAFRSILQALSHPCAIDAVVEVAAGDGTPVTPNVQCQYFPAERIANPSWVTSSVKVKQVMPVYLLTGPLLSPFWLDLTIAGERNQPDTDYSLVYRTDLFRPETARAIAREIETVICGEVESSRSAAPSGSG